jgi:hypothetical protein
MSWSFSAFGIFSPFEYVVQIKIWQPWCRKSGNPGVVDDRQKTDTTQESAIAN